MFLQWHCFASGSEFFFFIKLFENNCFGIWQIFCWNRSTLLWRWIKLIFVSWIMFDVEKLLTVHKVQRCSEDRELCFMGKLNSLKTPLRFRKKVIGILSSYDLPNKLAKLIDKYSGPLQKMQRHGIWLFFEFLIGKMHHLVRNIFCIKHEKR